MSTFDLTDFSNMLGYMGMSMIYNFIKKKCQRQPKYFYKVVFFPDKGLIERKLILNRPTLTKSIQNSMKYSTSLIYLVNVIENAEYTIDICLLLISLTDIAEALILAKVTCKFI